MLNSFVLYHPRCLTCGLPLAQYEIPYREWVEVHPEDTDEQILNSLGITDYCCRTHFFCAPRFFHNMENKGVIEGEYPAGGGPSFLDKSKTSINNLVQSYNKIGLKNVSFQVEMTGSGVLPKSQENEQVRKTIKSNILESKEKSNIFGNLKTKKVPLLKKLDDEEEEEKKNVEDEDDFGDILEAEDKNENVEEDEDEFEIPTVPGIPVIMNSDKLLADNTMKTVSVGFEDFHNPKEMFVKIIRGAIYLAE